MEHIKELVYKRFNRLAMLTISILFSLVLLLIRIKLNHSFFLIFLVWNLFLAVIPYTITSYLICKKKYNNLGVAFYFCLWLVFLPNAPYLVTDLIHLKLDTGGVLWLDILVIISFAFSGLLLFYLSILDMETILQTRFHYPLISFTTTSICFLSGFGVYLGRFLRYNSWEIVNAPIDLLNDITQIVTQPFANKEAWLFTLLFGMFLNIGYWIFKQLLLIRN